jgi:hypothetical protein
MGVESSPKRKKRDHEKRKREEAAWAARSGPVIVKRIDSSCVGLGSDDARSG